MKDVKDILDEAQEKMDMAVMYLEESLAHIRAGKADVRLLDGIRVDSYGSMVPINNVAAVTTPDAAVSPSSRGTRACSASLKGNHRLRPRHHARKQRRNYPHRHSPVDGRAP